MGWLSSFFLSPLGALFALSLPAVVALYFLKLKRKRRVVPSVLLWRQSLQEFTANAPFQKLKTNPLLLLQLLFLALLSLALMRPVFEHDSLLGVDLYIVIDRSASMGATDVEPNRLESAKSQIREQIRGLGQGDRMMVLAFSNRTEVVSPLTSDRGELLGAIDKIEVEDTGTSLEEAASILKASIGEQTDRSRIYLYTDGRLQNSEGLELPSAETHFVLVGTESENIGISRFSVNSSSSDPIRMDVFVELTAAVSGPGSVTLSTKLNDQLLDAQQVDWAAPGEIVRVFNVPRIEEGVLSVEIDNPDALLADNRAATRLSAEEPVRVLLVANGETPTARAIRAIPDLILEVASPIKIQATATADILVVDAVPPPPILPGVRGVFYLGSDLPAEWGVSATGEVEYPIVLDWDRSHPVTRGAEYGNLQVAKASRVSVPPDGTVLLESRETPLLFVKEVGEIRFAVATFSLFNSNWSRLYSFPITLTNAIRWLAKREDRLSLAAVYRTGETLLLPSVSQETAIQVTGPGGAVSSIPASPGERAFFGNATHVGEYQFDVSGEIKSEHFNLLDGPESTIASSSALQIGKVEIAAQAEASGAPREIWGWLALAGLLALMGEWWLYTRQAWV